MNDWAGVVVNMALLYRRYQRVLAATGDPRPADQAAWHLFGLFWLAGWGIVGTLMFGFLCVFWVGFLVPLVLCLLSLVGFVWAWSADRAWLRRVTEQAMTPPPIPR